MTLRVVRLGSPRLPDEGVRVGTVRRPPRGVPKEEFASRDFYDVWLPELSPSQPLVARGLGAQQAGDRREWERFVTAYRREMATPTARHLIALLAGWSQQGDLSVGCYCEDESWCHRGVLRELLAEAGADEADRNAFEPRAHLSRRARRQPVDGHEGRRHGPSAR